MHLLRPFLLRARLEEPALELTLGRRPQALQLDDRVEEIRAGRRKICDLASHLRVQRFPSYFFCVRLKPPDPV